MKANIKQIIKKYLIKENKTYVDVVNQINKNRSDDKKISKQNLNNKLTRGTIKYSEVLEIADVLGYNILWQKKHTDHVEIKNKSDIDYYDTVEKAYNSTFPPQCGKTDYLRLKEHSRIILIEQEISKFLTIIFNLISEVKLPELEIKEHFNALKDNKDNLSNESIFINYFSTLYNILLMTSAGNEFIPTLYFLRNTYINGGISKLPNDSRIQLIELLQYFNTKYYCYKYKNKDI